MKKSVFLGLLLIISLFAISVVSAEVFVSQPDVVYNIGDELSLKVTITEKADANGFFSASIVCAKAGENASEIEIVKMPLTVKANTAKDVPISGILDSSLIGDSIGTCFLQARYNEDQGKSQNFEISKEIGVMLEADKSIVSPGDMISVRGSAMKQNGDLLNGFIEAKIPEIGVSYSNNIVNGVFNFSFKVIENARAGSYNLEVYAYEKDGLGNINNEGRMRTDIRVRQVPRASEIALNTESIVPDNELIYSVSVFDQTNDIITGQEGKIVIYSPNGKEFSESLARSEETSTIKIESNYTPGYWKIASRFGEITTERQFNVEELQKISYSLDGNVMTITNVGNVPYRKSVEILVGENKEIVDLNLGFGASKKFKLAAPKGEYEIKVNEGTNETIVGSSLLTGNAIRVSDFREGGSWSSAFWIWGILIIIAGLVAIAYYGRTSNRSYSGSVPMNVTPAKSIKLPQSSGNIIDEGTREECAVVALKIKNMAEVDKTRDAEATDTIERAMNIARERGAKIYSDDKGYKTMVFAPSLTGEQENHLRAIRAAKDIESVLLEHNNKYALKLKFGIGAHSGEMIAGMHGNVRKFVPIGNTLSSAKDIADKTMQEVAVSEKVHRKLAGKTKSSRVEGYNFWKVGRIIDREQHSEFISKFMSKL